MLVVAITGLVTATFAPRPMPKALETLSAAMGQRLSCSPALRDEPLLARLVNAPPERVLKEIAGCFDAKWDAEAGGLVLRPDPAARRAREAAARRKVEAQIAGEIGELTSALAKHPTFGRTEADALRQKRAEAERKKNAKPDEETEEDSVGEESPSWRAAVRLAATLGPATFAAMRTGERETWAERANSVQRPFSGPALGVLGAFRREEALIAPAAHVDRIKLWVSCDGGASLSLALLALDERGGVVDGAMLELQPSDDAVPVKPNSTPEKPLNMPKEMVEYLDLLRSATPRDEAFLVWQSRLLDPVAHEPLSWYPGAALVAAAEAQDRNLLGTVSDLAPWLYRVRGVLTPSTVIRAMRGDVTLRDGWIVARLAEPLPRVSRAEARVLLRRAAKVGGLELDAGADWVARYPGSYPTVNWIGRTLSTFVSGSGAAGADATLDEERVGFWGTLPPSIRTALREGLAQPVAGLPPASQQLVHEQVYWHQDDAFGERDPTEAMPNGVLGGTVSLKVDEDSVVVPWMSNRGEPVLRRPLTPEDLGQRLGLGEMQKNPLPYDRYRIGVQRTYHLTFAFPKEGITVEQTMGETFFDPAGAPVERLPDAFAKRVEEARVKTVDSSTEP